MNNSLIPEEILEVDTFDMILEHAKPYQPSLHGRLMNLMKHGFNKPIISIRDLLSYPRSEFAHMPNFGKRCMRELDRILAIYSLRLAERKGESVTYNGLSVKPSEIPDPIYSMELHQLHEVHPDILVLRVPGGWIYSLFDTDNERHTCFVPDRN